MENKTAVEYLEEQIWKLDEQNYTLPLWLFEQVKQAKEMEKKQNIEDMQIAWKSSEQNMRFQFSSSHYKNVTFEQWLEAYKEK
jgi:hypothetical protein